MNILVTGGAGFIGSHIVDNYLKLGHHLVVVDNLSSGNKKNLNAKAKFYQEDIRSKKIWSIISKENIEVINHHAAQINVRKSVDDPVFDCQVNIEGTLSLLEACRKQRVKKVIFASSGGAIYGEAKVLPTPEDYHTFKPISPYGIAKLSAEYYLNYYYQAYQLSYVALRYGNVYGPRQDPLGEAGVIAIFIQKMLKNDQPIINGDGEQKRDFIFVEDVATSNIAALTGNFTGAVNIGTGRETSVNRLFSLLKQYVGKEVVEKHGPAKIGEQQRSALDIKKGKKILNWQPKVTIEEGIRKTVDYFRSN